MKMRNAERACDGVTELPKISLLSTKYGATTKIPCNNFTTKKWTYIELKWI